MRAPFLRGTLVTSCFALAVIVSPLVLFRSVPPPALPQVQEKLHHLHEHGRDYDVLFFGSSKIYNGFIPAVFDAALAERGHRFTSYNAGIDGMAFPESAYFVEQLLALRCCGPRWVLVELTPLRKRIPPAFRGTERAVFWHDVPRTSLCVRALVADAPTWRELNSPAADLLGDTPLRVAREHLALFARRLLRVGRGAQILSQRLGDSNTAPRTPPRPRDRPDPAERGYFKEVPIIADHEFARFRREMESFSSFAGEPANTLAEDAYLELERKIAAAGAKMLLVVFPNSMPNRRIFVQPRPDAPPLLCLDRPDLYPELYLQQNRSDGVHVNDGGAREFSKVLARRFAELLDVAR